MRTVKLVLVGPSGVGKTALRSKYISGRFFGGYRATIGADFISKTLPHPTNPEDSVTLQIWDTAGQERFSSLSNAFFRGADAAILMFDVNKPDTLEQLTKWWDELCVRAPLDEEDMESFCCIVVGNKIDIDAENGSEDDGARVTESETREFIKRLVPITSGSEEDIPPITVQPPGELVVPQHIYPNGNGYHHGNKHVSSNNESYSSHIYSNTMSSTKSGISRYFTPSSSFFDSFESALSSPRVSSTALHEEHSDPRLRRRGSDATASSRSTDTVTPSLFARENMESRTTDTARTTITIPDDDIGPFLSADDNYLAASSSTSWTQILPPYRGPALFFTSAKTGEGVSDIFEYIAHRVIHMSEYKERTEARRLHMREGNVTDTIYLESSGLRKNSSIYKRNCCSM